MTLPPKPTIPEVELALLVAIPNIAALLEWQNAMIHALDTGAGLRTLITGMEQKINRLSRDLRRECFVAAIAAGHDPPEALTIANGAVDIYLSQ